MLFIISTIIITIKFDSIIPILTNQDSGLGLTKELVLQNTSIIVLILILAASYMTSITNSLISLEGKNIRILKSLPIKYKTILMAKIYACLLITTPVLFIGNFILFIRFNIKIIDMIILLLLSILIPLVSHFIGLIVNLKYPKLDAENSTEVVKQSMSSFISVMIGVLLFIINISIITSIMGNISTSLLLFIALLIYILIDIVLYIYLSTRGVSTFNSLSI